MAEPSQAPAAAPAPSQTPAPAAPSVPEGFVQVSKQDWESAQRSKQQYEGWNTRWEKNWKGAFGDPSAIDALAATVQKRGVRGDTLPHVLDSIFSQKVEESGTTPKQEQQFDADSIRKMAEDAAETKWANREHEAAHKGSQESIRKLAKELAGDGASEWQVSQVALAIRGRTEENPLFYDKGHPLHEKYLRPYGDADLSTVKAWWLENETKAKAAHAAAVGKAAGQPAPRTASTPAGKATGQGPPTADSRPRKYEDTPTAELQARLDTIRAKRQRDSTA